MDEENICKIGVNFIRVGNHILNLNNLECISKIKNIEGYFLKIDLVNNVIRERFEDEKTLNIFFDKILDLFDDHKF